MTAALDRHEAHRVSTGRVPNAAAQLGDDARWWRRAGVQRPRPQVPIIAFARDGGLNWVRAMYTQAAAGNPTNLIQSCNANAPGV
jgi:hypothetical protein